VVADELADGLAHADGLADADADADGLVVADADADAVVEVGTAACRDWTGAFAE
jgi:hypothetical protein